MRYKRHGDDVPSLNLYKKENNMAKVTAQVLGGDPKLLEGVDTVAEVKSRLQVSGHTATVNGEAADDDYQLSDYEFVTLSPAVKGGA